MATFEVRCNGNIRVKICLKGYKPISRTFATEEAARKWAEITEESMKTARHYEFTCDTIKNKWATGCEN